MPEQIIPCVDCGSKTEEIELSGRYKVTGCTPLPQDPKWCLIRYERTQAPAEAGNSGKKKAKKALPAKLAKATITRKTHFFHGIHFDHKVVHLLMRARCGRIGGYGQRMMTRVEVHKSDLEIRAGGKLHPNMVGQTQAQDLLSKAHCLWVGV